MSPQAWLVVREKVLAEPALQGELWPLDEASLRRRLTELGAPADGGWPWDPGPIGVSPAALPPLSNAPAGPDWVPVARDMFSPHLVWRKTGGERPAAPFYFEDARNWGLRPLNRFLDVRTPVSALEHAIEGPEPAGIIFHLSRCGSTLVSRLLGQIENVTSLSEPPLLGQLLRARRFDPRLDPDRQAAWVRSLVYRNTPQGGRVVIKTEAGSILDQDILRRAFPTTPWVFLHRDPLDVLLSQSRERSPEMMSQTLEAAFPDPAQDDLDLHCARCLALICDRAAAALTASDGIAVSYEDLPAAVTTTIAPYFGLSPSHRDLARMQSVGALHARRGEVAFVDEHQARRGRAEPRLLQLANELARPAWERVRAIGQG